MRQKCKTIRSSKPDYLFKRDVLHGNFDWLFQDDVPRKEYDDDGNPIDDEDEEDWNMEEEYEDELIEANRRAGFWINDDGECVYEDED